MPAKDMPRDEREVKAQLDLAAKLASEILDHVGDDNGGDALTVLACLGGIMLAGFPTAEMRRDAAEKLRVGMLRMAGVW